jgi:hypothetical protein
VILHISGITVTCIIGRARAAIVISDKVEALRNDRAFENLQTKHISLRRSKDIVSLLTILSLEIDEKRILSNLYSVEGTIIYEIMDSKLRLHREIIITGDGSI